MAVRTTALGFVGLDNPLQGHPHPEPTDAEGGSAARAVIARCAYAGQQTRHALDRG